MSFRSPPPHTAPRVCTRSPAPWTGCDSAYFHAGTTSGKYLRGRGPESRRARLSRTGSLTTPQEGPCVSSWLAVSGREKQRQKYTSVLRYL